MRAISFADGFTTASAPTSGQVFQGPDGSTSAPAWSFSGDTNTGIYRQGTDALGFVTGGTEAGYIDSSQQWYLGKSGNTGSMRVRAADVIYITSGSTDVFQHIRSVTTGRQAMSGGTGIGNSGSIILYGNSYASDSKANYVEILNNGTVATFWDADGHQFVTNRRSVRFREATGGGTNYVGLRAPAAVTSDLVWDLMGVDGQAGQAVVTDGAAALGLSTYLTLGEIGTPATPASGFGRTYFKSDGKMYSLNDAGSELALKTDLNVAVVAAKTGAYTATSTDEYIPCDATSAAFTITLPAAASNSGKQYLIKKVDSSFNAVTIDANASETIDGSTTTTLNTQYESVTITCDGSNWSIRSRYINEATQTYTPTGSWSSNTTYTGFWHRKGDWLHGEVKVATSGAPTSATLTVNLPTNLTIDTAKLTHTTAVEVQLGACSILDSGTTLFYGPVLYSSTTAVAPRFFDSSTSNLTASSVTQAAPMTFASGDNVVARFAVPISGWKG